jgi:serine protease inhibitor
MAKMLRLVLTTCVCIAFISCDPGLPPDGDGGGDPGDRVLTDGELVDAANRFGFKLFKEIVEAEPDQNIVISPLSVSIALGMTQNGAAGSTLDAMMSTLEFPGYTLESANQCYRIVIDYLIGLDPDVRFQIANSIWYRQEFAPKKLFTRNCQTYFDAEVEGLDFSLPEAADVINLWVEEKTNGLITGIVDKPIDWQIMMILLNAIYFKGSWLHHFDPANTRDWQFKLPDGGLSPCRMMMQEESKFYTGFEGPDFYGLDMAYGDSLFSMTILLPKQTTHVDSVVGCLNEENWKAWMSRFAPWEVVAFVPKFELEYEVSLVPALTKLGMGIAFGRDADFSNMFQHSLWVYLSKVKHKTYIRVNEEGTEAAAVTEVVPTTGTRYIIIEKPFIFFIRENRSDTILFMGKIVDPGYFE